MILSKLVVTWLDWLIEIGIWVFLIAATIAGFNSGDGFFGSIFGAIIGLFVGGIMAALIFGFFIIVSDIRRMMKAALNEQGNSAP